VVQAAGFAGDETSDPLPGFDLAILLDPLLGIGRHRREQGHGTAIFDQYIGSHLLNLLFLIAWSLSGTQNRRGETEGGKITIFLWRRQEENEPRCRQAASWSTSGPDPFSWLPRLALSIQATWLAMAGLSAAS